MFYTLGGTRAPEKRPERLELIETVIVGLMPRHYFASFTGPVRQRVLYMIAVLTRKTRTTGVLTYGHLVSTRRCPLYTFCFVASADCTKTDR